ncbi:hypothetical protein APUTEX25_000789, partial [Auxenochlorella protothecoides]
AADDLDVTSTVISPSFRSAPWNQEAKATLAGEPEPSSQTLVLFVSESGVCRSALAAAAFQAAIQAVGLEDRVRCQAVATQSFNVGEGPERAAVTAARARGLEIPPDFAARQFDPGADMARCDLVLVMDKFTASDVLREASGLAVGFGGLTPWVSADAEQGRANTGITVFDSIDTEGRYSTRVRYLRQFQPDSPEGMTEIEDPLYGNTGGAGEAAAMSAAASLIVPSCQGLAAFLADLNAGCEDGAALKARLAETVDGMQGIDWLVPPLLRAGT